MHEKENEINLVINVKSNMDDLLIKAERFNSLMKEAKTLADELASFSLEFNV